MDPKMQSKKKLILYDKEQKIKILYNLCSVNSVNVFNAYYIWMHTDPLVLQHFSIILKALLCCIVCLWSTSSSFNFLFCLFCLNITLILPGRQTHIISATLCNTANMLTHSKSWQVTAGENLWFQRMKTQSIAQTRAMQTIHAANKYKSQHQKVAYPLEGQGWLPWVQN